VQHALAMQTMERTSLMLAANRPGLDRKNFRRRRIERLLPVLENLRGKLEDPYFGGTAKATVAEMGRRWRGNRSRHLACAPIGARAHCGAARSGAHLDAHARDARTMQKGPFARDVMRDVIGGLETIDRNGKKYGVRSSQMVIDPGIGLRQKLCTKLMNCWRNCRNLRHLVSLMVGTSRKGFPERHLRKTGTSPAEERIWGTAQRLPASILKAHTSSAFIDVAK